MRMGSRDFFKDPSPSAWHTSRPMSDTDTFAGTVRGRILEELQKSDGVIPFSQFMDVALYSPGAGYYEREASRVGKAGDFITSVSVGPLFGELLALQFGEWLRGTSELHGPILLVECGAHDGKLARDLLGTWKRLQPNLYERVTYWSVDSSAIRRPWQQETLAEHSGRVRWADGVEGLPDAFEGIFYANELFDAFPVTRVAWRASEGRWLEQGVGRAGETFHWVPMGEVPLGTVQEWLGMTLPQELLQVLPDGFILDVMPRAARWWTEMARKLGRGYLVTLDYGLEADEFLTPRYRQGTLRGYHRQRVVEGPMSMPGEIDLTAHVNWTALRKAGEAVGLKTVYSGTQRQFLVEILSRSMKQGRAIGLDWTPSEVRQFQTLTHPEHLGRAFRVLAQGRF